MPQTASKESKRDIKERGRVGVEMFREEKKRPLREYMLMQNPFASLVL